MKERTVFIIKPDGVQRALIGECISRIEKSGLKIIAMKMLKPTAALVEKHYPNSEEWLRRAGQLTLDRFKEDGRDVKSKLGTTDPLELGKTVKGWLNKFLSSGPVVAMVIEGYRAIESVRKIAGLTDPAKAGVGSIRGDFSIDSAGNSNFLGRPTLNLVHASGDAKEAANEIKLWFTKAELVDYKRCDEDLFYKEQ